MKDIELINPSDSTFVIDDKDDEDDDDDKEEEDVEYEMDAGQRQVIHELSEMAGTDGGKTAESMEIDTHIRFQSERTKERIIRVSAVFMILVSMLCMILYVLYDRESAAPSSSSSISFSQSAHDGDGDTAYDSHAEFTEEEIEQMRQKMTPTDLITKKGDEKTFESRQFVHLHHMKTGGTSMDTLIRCSTGRLQQMGYHIPYSTLSECSLRVYEKCVSADDQGCVSRMSNAAVLSFCGPLRDLPVFSWTPSLLENDDESHIANPTSDEQQIPTHPVHAVTVLRHPVDRVWSMYRFKTKACYKCKTLSEVYEIIDSGRAEEEFGHNHESCSGQLENHMTRNLIQHKMDGLVDDVVRQAVDDIKSFFNIVGLTEDMNSTRIMTGHVFPWLAERMEGSSITCSMPHSNKSPRNNRCGPGGTHWDLPPHPSEEEAELIRKHNQLDLEVYHAGERQHRLQKIVLGLEEP